MPVSRLLLCPLLQLMLPWAAYSEAQKTAKDSSIEAALPVAIAREVREIDPAFLSAPKLAGNLLKLPLSATVSDAEFLNSAMIRTVKDAAIYAPNTLFVEGSAPRFSQPYVRGMGGSSFNPGVTTFIDGVPQLHASSSSLNLVDVAQIDFTRGPMGTLFGRNTAGGGIHITSNRPSLSTLGGEFQTTIGNYNLWDFRGSVTGPLIQDHLGFSVAGGLSERDGYSQNTLTGQDTDHRNASFGKAQFLWVPNEKLEVRIILAGESNRDGGYAFTPLTALRQRPRELNQDFMGMTSRDVISPTLQVIYHAETFDFSSTTGYVGWRTDDASDMDYSAVPLIRQRNREQMRTWTQEFRFSNPDNELVTLSDELKLGWQAGMLLFHSEYRQNLNFEFPDLPIPLPKSTDTSLTQWGIGAYMQGNLIWKERLSLTAGIRWDYEKKEADIHRSNIGIGAAAPLGGSGFIDYESKVIRTNQLFSQVTPHAALSYQFNPAWIGYLSFSTGYKAGGFNAYGPVEYDEEHSQSYEIGLKGRTWSNKLSLSVAAFYTDWQNLQINQNASPTLTFIQNTGEATSRGLETNLALRLSPRLTIFGSASWQDTRFRNSAKADGLSIKNNQLPYAPDYSFTLGALLNQPLTASLTLYARIDIQTLGSFHYDVENSTAQDAYSLANFRLGLRQNAWFAEAFVNNAFNTEYVPIAMASQSGFGIVGESGPPLTFGVRLGLRF